MLGITTTNARVGGFRGGISAEAKTIYNRIIADGGVSNLTRLNFFVKGLKAIYGDLANVPVCYDAHWIGYKLGSGTGATAGQAAAKLYSLTVAGDAVQATAASQPLLLSHNGTSTDNYWYGSGVSGNYCSTPNATANQITGDIEIITKVDFSQALGRYTIVSSWGGPPLIGFTMFIQAGIVNYECSVAGGYNLASSTVAISTIYSGFLKVTRIASSGIVKFYTSTDGVTYTQLGANVATTAGNQVVSSLALQVGRHDATLFSFLGKISRLTISNTIGGSPVVDFNPAQYNAATSQTQWTSSTGEVWTINTGTATTGYKGCLVSRTLVQSDGVDDLLLTGNVDFSTTDKVTMYSAVKKLSTTFGLITTIGSNTNRISAFIDGITYRGFNTNGGLTNDYNTTTNSTALVLFTNTLDRSLTAINEQNFYYNNSLLGKVAIVSNDTTGNLGNNPIALFARLDSAAPSNNILNTFIATKVVDSSTIQTAVYNLIRSLNNNAF